MRHTTENCPLCKKLFSYDSVRDSILRVDLNNPDNILKDYPVQDDTWPSRQWNEDKTEWVDLSGHTAICEDCYSKRIFSKDVNVDGHVICSVKGCANDSNSFSKYCYRCYDQMYPPQK